MPGLYGFCRACLVKAYMRAYTALAAGLPVPWMPAPERNRTNIELATGDNRILGVSAWPTCRHVSYC